MMSFTVVSVFDAAAECFCSPLYCKTKGDAVRMFSDEVNRSGSAMGLHPGDYKLYYLGLFDEQEGKFELLRNPEMICSALNVYRGGGDESSKTQ